MQKTQIFSKLFADYPNSAEARQNVMSFFGHDIDDKDVLNVFKEASKDAQKESLFAKILKIFVLPLVILRGPINLIKDVNYFMNENRYSLVDKIKQNTKPKEVLNSFYDEHLRVSAITLKHHGPITLGSSMKTMLLRKTLAGAQGNTFRPWITKTL